MSDDGVFIENYQSEYSFAVKLPQIVEVGDYHEFGHIEDHLRHVLGDQINVEEVCYSNYGTCVGVIYVGQKPKKLIKDLLKAFEYDEED
jgi:CO dehydrogenase/acetyl-CoA synthase alpha subunit